MALQRCPRCASTDVREDGTCAACGWVAEPELRVIAPDEILPPQPQPSLGRIALNVATHPGVLSLASTMLLGFAVERMRRQTVRSLTSGVLSVLPFGERLARRPSEDEYEVEETIYIRRIRRTQRP